MARNQNFSQFASSLRAAAAKFEKDVKEVVEFNIGEMELESIRLAPGGGDMIATQNGPESQQDIARGRSWVPISQAIGYKLTNNGFTGTLYVEKSAGPIAAWIEFGTGQSAQSYLATVPPEWKALAQRYYINGKGTIINSPYILPSFMKHKEEFIKDLKNVIANFGKGI